MNVVEWHDEEDMTDVLSDVARTLIERAYRMGFKAGWRQGEAEGIKLGKATVELKRPSAGEPKESEQ